MAHKRTSNIQLLCVVSLYLAIFTILVPLLVTAQRSDASPRSMASTASTQPNGSSNTLTTLSFLPAVTYDSGASTATSVAVADVNGDGKPDLLVANACASNSDCSHGSAGVLLGRGRGQFGPARLYDSGGFTANSITVADLNGDGKPDLIVANCALGPHSSCPAPGSNGAVGILLGNGDGTFQPAVTYDSGAANAFSVAVVDLNGDGKLDLVVGNYSYPNPSTVRVLLGNGDGTFQPATVYTLGGSGAVSIAAADVNGDGIPDLLVSCNGGEVAVLLGNGDGTFRMAGSYSSGSFNHWGVVAADVNGDGKPDMIVVNADMGVSSEGTVAILLGNGDGTFQPAVTYDTGGIGPRSLAAGDVNGDGMLDVVVANEVACNECDDRGSAGVLLGNGDGTFQPSMTFDSGGAVAVAIQLADVNDDGRGDLVTAHRCRKVSQGACFGDGIVGVLLNNTSFCATPPVVTLSITPTSLWPPNGKVVPVTMSGTITDTGCTIETAAYAVTDEYGKVQPSGPVTLGPGGAYSLNVLLQASRLGNDLDGRLYTVTVSATNNGGNTGSQSGTVVVPHDQGH
jgi:hypothetical protein